MTLATYVLLAQFAIFLAIAAGLVREFTYPAATNEPNTSASEPTNSNDGRQSDAL